MRLWKRVLALVLVISTGLVGFVFPAIPDRAAKAEFVPLGTTDLPKRSGELLEYGEWLYWLDDDFAIIAGYTNEQEEYLKTPSRLNGHAVVGIDHGAFMAHSRLKRIELHSNVTRIAKDAFGQSPKLTIEAYNGSFALWYAKQQGFQYVNRSTMPDYVLRDEAIDMSGAPSRAYTIESDHAVSFRTDCVFFKSGDVLCFPEQSGYINGMAGRVSQIYSTSAQYVRVELANVELPEIVNEFRGYEKTFLDWDNARYYEGFEPIDGKGEIEDARLEINFHDRIQIPASLSQRIGVTLKLGDADLTGEIGLALNPVTVSYNVALYWIGADADVDIDIPMSADVSLSLGYSKDRATDLKKLKKQKNKNKICEVPLVKAGVVSGDVAFNLKWEIRGEFKVSATIEVTTTYSFRNSKLTKRTSKHLRYGSLELNVEGKIGPELNVELILGFSAFGKKIGLTVAEASIGVFLNFQGNIALKAGFSGSKNSIVCGDAKVYLSIDGEGKVGAVKIVLGGKEHPLEAYANAPFRIEFDPFLSGHIDNLKIVSKCVLEDRKVVFLFGGNLGSAEARYDVGAYIPEPKVPNRPGYRFEGWYVNKTKSKWSGAPDKWNFRKMTMPLLGLSDALVLFAKWTPLNSSMPADNYDDDGVDYSDGDPTIGGGGSYGGGTAFRYFVTPAPTPEPTPSPTPPPVPVTGIALNKTSAAFYKGDAQGTLQLTASVQPENASSKEVQWTSSNDSIAYVDKNGLVKIGNSGEAVITCRSAVSGHITAQCAINVKQRVEEVFIDAEHRAIAPGETLQLTGTCYPLNAENKALKWSSADASIATVSSTGLVTGVKYGQTTIKATAQDGTGIVGSFNITVERELTLEKDMVADTVYAQGEAEYPIAYISPTVTSARRMAQKGYTLNWRFTAGNQNTVNALEEIDTALEDQDGNIDTTIALLSCAAVKSAGNQTVTVVCEAGPYSASIQVPYTVSSAQFAGQLKISPSTITTNVGASTLLTNKPQSADGKTVPGNLSMEIAGGRYWSSAAQETETAEGIAVSFSESGLYDATLIYRAANLVYSVPVTFYVRDENGNIRLKVDGIELNKYYASMVDGDTLQLLPTLSPSDAYDKRVTWRSDDESIATVSQNGLVRARGKGTAAIYCEAQDGSGCAAVCVVNVESFLCLDEHSVSKTVHTTGEPHAELEIVNVTMDSERRLQSADLNVSWQLEKLSGNAVELAMEAFTSVGEQGISVSGNRLRLVRVNGAGQSEYRLTCRAGSYSDTCLIHITAKNDALPTAVTLARTTYKGAAGEVIEIDTTPKVSPNGRKLPEDVAMTIDGSKAFRSALSGDYNPNEPARLIFSRAGSYAAEVIFSGANYAYRCPITIEVANEQGAVPQSIEDVRIQPENVTLLVGESVRLTGEVLPASAPHSGVNWSSYDTSVATVSAQGVVTAIDSGITIVTLSVPESDIEAACVVIVEDGMSLQQGALERTVFVDGATRVKLDTVMLTEASSLRLNGAPEWTLTRASGSNLTLRAEGTQTVNEDGDALYGCDIWLYSVSRTGDAVYTLTAKSGSDTATITITVHAVDRDAVLPATVELSQTTYEAGIGELIVVQPELTCWPEGTALPNGIVASIEGDSTFVNAVNAEDFYVSQSVSTLSFKEAGTFEANLVYRYSNVRYDIPVRFRIRDGAGDVPVLASGMKLSQGAAYMVAGDQLKLEAVFQPADVTNQNVTWTSSNPSVVKVSSDGTITALKNGQAVITCKPSDTHVSAARCAVTVEDYFTIETGMTTISLYLQGAPDNELPSAWLSTGTQQRLAKDGLTAEWTLDRPRTHAQLSERISSDGAKLSLKTTALLTAGTDRYVLRCTAGTHTWEKTYTLNVVDQGVNAPEAVGIKNASISLSVGQKATIDFSPVCQPSSSILPNGMSTYYVGLGEFYDALDYSAYAENGDSVTVGFTRSGRYVLTRQYMLGNLHYTSACTINVGAQTGDSYQLLRASETDGVVYIGGKSGIASTISLADGMIAQEWGDSLTWTLTRVSGNSLVAAIKPNGSAAELYVTDVKKKGTDVWRVSCAFGGIVDHVDIRLTAAQPTQGLPTSIALQRDHLTGITGNWLTVPLGVVCEPSGTALPDVGDAFWDFAMDGYGGDVADFEVKNNLLYLNFAQSGYYTGKLTYRSGNVSYALPLYFTIEDEAGSIATPDLKLFITDAAPTVYPEGDTGIVIGRAVVAERLSTYVAGASVAYLEGKDAAWSIRNVSGSAAQLSIRRNTANIYDIVLEGIRGTGDVQYRISCILDGKTLTQTGTLHVATTGEARPDATLRHITYNATVNEELSIDRRLYSRKDGSVLQSSTTWNAEALMAAMGYSYQERSNSWLATFYEPGTYTSAVTGYVGNLKVTSPLTIIVAAAAGPISPRTLKLPKALTTIEAEAFMGTAADIVDLRGTRIKTIDARAFKNSVDLKAAYLPESVSTIGQDAFYGCLNLTIYCKKGSIAEAYAVSNGIEVVYY